VRTVGSGFARWSGLIVIGVLVALIVPAWRAYQRDKPAGHATRSSSPASTAPVSTAASATSVAVVTHAATQATATAPPRHATSTTPAPAKHTATVAALPATSSRTTTAPSPVQATTTRKATTKKAKQPQQAGVGSAVGVPAPTTAASPVTTVAGGGAGAATTAATTAAAAAGTRFVFRASRGDSWLAVHARASNGPVLFQGVLQRGRTLRITSDRVWIRFGGAGNLDVFVNGKAVLGLPKGTVNVVATASSVRLATQQ
jgi:cytoskeletal protein RodZ